MTPFDFRPSTRIVFGPGKIDSLGLLVRELGASRALVVSDPGIKAAGHDDRGLAALRKEHAEALLFDDVVQNPTTETVDACLRVAQDFRPDVIVGLGGGSSIDCAKGVNFLYTNGGRMQDYWGVGKATKPMLPMIAAPTTAGTGSEAQSFALISDAETHVKMACGDRKAACRVALLDPELTVTQPPKVTALTGLDAISHAMETYVTKPRNSVSLALSRAAWRLLEPNFPRVLDDPHDLEARGAMQVGACFAGLAIENSMLGATHALANPLTQHYNIVHGQAVALMLPHVIRFNGQEFDHLYLELLEGAVARSGPPHNLHAAMRLADRITSLVKRAGLATHLSEFGVEQERLPQLAADAATQWTSKFNPRQVSETELLALYEAAL